jgi:hypothetical protein
MTEQVIKLYVEQETFKETFDVSYPFTEEASRKKWGVNSPDLIRTVRYEIYNSFHKDLDYIVEKMKLDRNLLLDLRSKSIDKISIISIDLINQHLFKGNYTVMLYQPEVSFSRHSLQKVIDLKANCLIKFKNDSLQNTIKKYNQLNFIFPSFLDNNIVLSSLHFRNKDLKYQIYIDDRLLIERKYPIDIERNRMIMETIVLSKEAKGTIRIVSDFNLIFKKVLYNEESYNTYGKVFSIPPNPDK